MACVDTRRTIQNLISTEGLEAAIGTRFQACSSAIHKCLSPAENLIDFRRLRQNRPFPRVDAEPLSSVVATWKFYHILRGL